MQEIEIKNVKEDYRTREAYRSLRTNIEFSGEDKKIIVVTSCTPGEGKSSVSFSLARSLADAGKKVLYIDADMRKSVMVSRYKEISSSGEIKGLSHFLSGQAKIADVMYRIKDERLVVIFAGVTPPNPAELLGGPNFEKLLTSARDVWDYVIIDSPPLGSVIDSAIITRQCDASVMVIAANEISRRFAQNVKDQLDKSGCPILGVVLNKVDMAQNKYYGKYYSKYYGKYYGHSSDK